MDKETVKNPITEVVETDHEILEQLRGYEGWTLDREALAVAAMKAGWFRPAHDLASARFWAAMGSSSLSSRTVRVFGPKGSDYDTEAFLQLFEAELRRALAE